ncbi:MAG: type II toxin-antitoxin system VapC family toxin [Polyangiaceae bacterium]|nr:type II toxin-antitoxin system VapC family toxin [Polyangiaceae bacterium]
MALTHLLDTSVLSRLMREPSGTTAGRLADVGDEAVCTSIVVASELRYGAARRGSDRLRQAVERILDAIPVLALDAPADHHYAAIRAHLERDGTPVEPNDLLIVAHARALGLILVTENAAELARVPELVVENWAEPTEHA